MHETVARARCHIKIVKNCRAQNSPARILLTPATWSRAEFAELIFQKLSETLTIFFTLSIGNRALTTVSCTFCWPHRPKVLRARQFFYDFYVKSSYRPVRILSTPSSKSAPNPSGFYDFYIDSSSGNNPVHILLTTFPDGTAKPRKQRPSFGDHSSHFHRKNTGFRARECFQTWIHTFPIPHTSQLLSSWCGCHDDCKPSWWES